MDTSFSVLIHDWRPTQIESHPITIDTQTFRKEDNFSLRIGEFSIITTRDRLKELRGKIDIALCVGMLDPIDPPDAEEDMDEDSSDMESEGPKGAYDSDAEAEERAALAKERE